MNEKTDDHISTETEGKQKMKCKTVINDKKSFWFALLGFISRFWGLILYLIYEDKKPLRAKSIRKGMIIGIIFKIILIILIIFLFILGQSLLKQSLLLS